MTFEDYQAKAIVTDLAGGTPQPIASTAFYDKLLGLVGEAGEVADKFKKIYRDEGGVISPQKLLEIEKELGDVLWYISVMSTYLGLSLNDVANKNIDKLHGRMARGKLSGSGDSR